MHKLLLLKCWYCKAALPVSTTFRLMRCYSPIISLQWHLC